MKIKINPKFQALLRPQTDAEREHLKESIREEGCREPLVVTRKGVLVDGHSRYEICKELGIRPAVVIRDFDSDEEIECWIIRTQLARRNLNPTDYRVLVGQLYNSRKLSTGGQSKPQGGATSEKIGDELGVSSRS